MTDVLSPAPQVLGILSDVLEVTADDLRTRPVLSAHQWDSLTSLEALCALETRFSVRLDMRAYNAVQTVDDMVALVTSAASVQQPG